MLTCPRCTEWVQDDLEICWGCGTSQDGVEDPAFLPADEYGPLVDPIEDREIKDSEKIEADFGELLPNLVDCYQAEGVTEARFVADQIRLTGIPAVSGRYDLFTDYLGGPKTNTWNYGPRVRVRPQDFSHARSWAEAYQKKRRDRRNLDE